MIGFVLTPRDEADVGVPIAHVLEELFLGHVVGALDFYHLCLTCTLDVSLVDGFFVGVAHAVLPRPGGLSGCGDARRRFRVGEQDHGCPDRLGDRLARMGTYSSRSRPAACPICR